MIHWTKIILIVTDLPVLVTAVIALISIRSKDKCTRIFSLFLLFSALIQITALIFWLLHLNNMPLLHLYVPGGFILLSLFYATILKNLINTRIITAITIVFVLYSIINSIFIQKVSTFNSYALSIESVLLIILSIFTFLVFLNQKKDSLSAQEITGLTWINSGIFLYYTADLLLFYFGNYIMNRLSVSDSSYTWVFHSFYSIVMNSFFIIGLWKRHKKYL